jgi:hypothetical protein
MEGQQMADEQALPMKWPVIAGLVLLFLGTGCDDDHPYSGDSGGDASVTMSDGAAEVPPSIDVVAMDESQPTDGGLGMEVNVPDVVRGDNMACAEGASAIDVNSMLLEATDLAGLARRSAVRFTTREASSYDRHSVTPAPSSPTPDGWYANTDWGNYLRVENTANGAEHVLVDAEGPGALVRIWTANGQEGTLRIYLDDMATPVITADFVALLTGKVPPFTAPFAVVNSTGRNLDFPMPFRKRAKVTVTGSANVPATAYFYQVFYRQYAACGDVVTFRKEDITADALERARSALLGPASPPGAVVEARLDANSPTLSLAAADGGEEIVELVIKPDALDTATLRQTQLSMAFDGRQTVLTPLGDFFGAGPGLLAHRTLPLEVRDDGTLISRFVMPFKSTATITLGLKDSRTAVVQLRHRQRSFDVGTYHFNAHWTARGPIPSRPFRDLVLADLTGEGTFVGTMLAHDDLSPEWWGEGDEKIFVDGEAFPSFFGTGTEDYFGYAYSSREPFDHAYRTLRPTGQSRGQLTNARFHVLDVIRFDSALRFNMEEWHWDPNATVYFDTLVYFYGKPGLVDAMPPPGAADFRLPPHP